MNAGEVISNPSPIPHANLGVAMSDLHNPGSDTARVGNLDTDDKAEQSLTKGKGGELAPKGPQEIDHLFTSNSATDVVKFFNNFKALQRCKWRGAKSLPRPYRSALWECC
jgi:hypothetical protein